MEYSCEENNLGNLVQRRDQAVATARRMTMKTDTRSLVAQSLLAAARSSWRQRAAHHSTAAEFDSNT